MSNLFPADQHPPATAEKGETVKVAPTETTMPHVKAELIRNLPFGAYCDIDAVNASTLLTYKGQSPVEARHEQIHALGETTAQVQGHASHSAILQPDIFERDYAMIPKYGRKKADLDAKAKWETEHAQSIILDAREYGVAVNVRNAILKGPLSCLFTGDGINEATILWTDEKTGLRCKARIDRLTTWRGYQCLVDLKTARSITDYAVGRAIAEFHYHIRMAFYAEALRAVDLEPNRVILAWALNSEPWTTRATDMLEDTLAEGAAWWRKLLDLHARCVMAGDWPGYGDCPEPIGLPKWAFTLTQPKGE